MAAQRHRESELTFDTGLSLPVDSGPLGHQLRFQPLGGAAYHSTDIPNIEVQFEALPAIRRMTQTPAFIKSFLGLGFMQTFLKAQVDRMPEGPSEATRRAGQAVILGEARNGDGQTVSSRLRTPEGYTLTALTAFDAAKRVAAVSSSNLPGLSAAQPASHRVSEIDTMTRARSSTGRFCNV